MLKYHIKSRKKLFNTTSDISFNKNKNKNGSDSKKVSLFCTLITRRIQIKNSEWDLFEKS